VRAAAQEKLESSEAQVRELSERLALLEREKVELEMRSAALANGAGSAVAAGLLVRHRARAACLPDGDRAPERWCEVCRWEAGAGQSRRWRAWCTVLGGS